MAKIRIGIIGLGMAWERLHAPAYARLSDKFEISAVCDNDIENAKSVARWIGLDENVAYDDYNQMLKDGKIEAVDVIVPINENYECAKAVIENGKHLVIEKPFCASMESAKELIKLSNKNGVKVMVAENFRYDEENVLIKNLISEHRIGNVVYFIDNHVTEFQKDMLCDTFASTEWRKFPEFKGGQILDSGIHHLARHRFLFGNIESVYANGRSSEAEFSPYSCINALLSFENEISGHYAFYMVGKETQAPLVGLRIFGTNGEIYLEDKDCGFVNVSYKDGFHEAIAYNPGEGYYQELNNFYESLRNCAEIVSTPEKELGDMEAVFAILDSIAKQKPVKPVYGHKPLSKGFKSSNIA